MDIFANLNLTIALAALLGLAFIGALIAAARSMLGHSDPALDRLKRGAVKENIQRDIIKGNIDVDEEAIQTETRVQKMLRHANITHPQALQFFLATKVLLAILLPLGFLTVNMRLTEPFESSLAIATLLGISGLFVPNIWLSSKVRSRQLAIERSLPDALDLLVTCVEAGLGLDAALSRVANEIRVSSPLLADELRTTFLEVGAGMSRIRAFRRLAERTGVEDVRSLSATLAQTERFGTSVGTALRVRAEWMRTRRMQNAEERAAVVSVKMTIPLVLCILPSLVAIIMGPAAVRIATQLLPFLGGE